MFTLVPSAMDRSMLSAAVPVQFWNSSSKAKGFAIPKGAFLSMSVMRRQIALGITRFTHGLGGGGSARRMEGRRKEKNTNKAAVTGNPTRKRFELMTVLLFEASRSP